MLYSGSQAHPRCKREIQSSGTMALSNDDDVKLCSTALMMHNTVMVLCSGGAVQHSDGDVEHSDGDV